jgi:MSHA pilin protein MshD
MFVRKCSLTLKVLSKGSSKLSPNNNGFTLIELVIGIVVMSIALMVMTGALFPQAERSTNPWFQVRSAELAQSMMNEILARRYDENSAQIGSLRCGESSADSCTTINDCGFINSGGVENPWVEENSRDLYDDIDDFHCYSVTGDGITNIENDELVDVYKGFSVDVTVQYAGGNLGLDATNAKLITVIVTPPKGNAVVYASYRTNY